MRFSSNNSNKSNKSNKQKTNSATLQGDRIPSSNGLYNDRQGKKLDQESTLINEFNPNQNAFEETALDVQVLKAKANKQHDEHEEKPLEVVEEKKSSNQSQQVNKQLEGQKSSFSEWKWPTMDWTSDLCQQTQCLKKITSVCDWFKSLTRKQQVAVVLCAILLTACILTPCIVLPILLIPRPPQGMYMSPYEYNGTTVSALFLEGRTSSNHLCYAYATHKKIQVPHSFLELVTKIVQTPSGQQQIHCNVPILSLLAVLGSEHKQQKPYTDWLQYYNANPREATQKLIQTIRSTLVRPGTYKFGKKVVDNLTLVSIKEGLEIDVEYRPIEMRFVAANFGEDYDGEGKSDGGEKNLKMEDTTEKDPVNDNPSSEGRKIEQAKNQIPKDNTPAQIPPNKPTLTPQQKQRQISTAMLQSIYYLKRVISRNLQIIRSTSNSLLSYQKNLIDDKQFTQQWQKSLVNGCRTLESLRFRCSIEAAGVLVPGLTLEQIQQNGEYLVSQTVDLVLKEVKEVGEIQINLIVVTYLNHR